MQIFFMKNIIPITIIAVVFGAISIGSVVQQKSIIETASAEDEILTSGGESMGQAPTEKPSVPPSGSEIPMGNPSEYPIENFELPEEMTNQEEPVELPVGYDDGPDPKMSKLPSGMQIVRTSFDASSSEQTQEGPGPVEPPDPTDIHSDRTGKHGGFKGQMGHELPPVITMGEQSEDGGLTNVTRGYHPE